MKLDDLAKTVNRLQRKREKAKKESEPVTIRLIREGKEDRFITFIPKKEKHR